MKLMVDLAKQFKDDLEKKNLTHFGEMLDYSWQLKKEVSDGISNLELDAIYEAAKSCGAKGGKILGAGGGGFMLLFADSKSQIKINADSGFINIGDEFLINPSGLQKKIISNYCHINYDKDDNCYCWDPKYKNDKTSKLIVSSADWLRVKAPPAFAKPLPPVKVIVASLITGAAPLEAVVILPYASTVIEARV